MKSGASTVAKTVKRPSWNQAQTTHLFHCFCAEAFVNFFNVKKIAYAKQPVLNVLRTEESSESQFDRKKKTHKIGNKEGLMRKKARIFPTHLNSSQPQSIPHKPRGMVRSQDRQISPAWGYGFFCSEGGPVSKTQKRS